MTSPSTLLLQLCGPMQAWGSRSQFDDRDTNPEPTRSGVIGLLCAALGVPRTASLERFASLRMGVRVDAPGRVMVDYHTAQRLKSPSPAAPCPGQGWWAPAGGSRRVSGPSVESTRHYLADACFLVGLECRELPDLRELEAALREPVWALYLGRKSFPLAEPVCLPGSSIRPGVPLEAALRLEPLLLPARDGVRLILEEDAGSHTLVRTDVPLSFASRRFIHRHVRTAWLAQTGIGEPNSEGAVP